MWKVSRTMLYIFCRFSELFEIFGNVYYHLLSRPTDYIHQVYVSVCMGGSMVPVPPLVNVKSPFDHQVQHFEGIQRLDEGTEFVAIPYALLIFTALTVCPFC